MGALGVFAAFGVLVGSEVSGLHSAAAILFGLYYLAAAAGARITGRFMDRRGRRLGLVAGYVLLAMSGLVAFSATVLGSFTVLLVSGVMLGLGAGAALLGRAAVADMHPPSSGGALSAVWWWRERWARWEVLRWGARSTPSLTG